MIQQSEKATEAQFDSLQQSINAKLSRLDHMPTMWQIATTVVSGLIVGATAILTIVAYASDRFDGGVGMGTSIGDKFAENRLEIQKNALRDDETRLRVDRLIERIDHVITRMDAERPANGNGN